MFGRAGVAACPTPLVASSTVRRMSAEARLSALGVTLPSLPGPAPNRVSARAVGDLLYLSGHGPRTDGGVITGKVDAELTLEGGRDAARVAGLGLLSTIRAELGSLDRVRQIVKVFGMVNCSPGFTRLPEVIDGCSDLMVEVFGDAGRHARSAVGMAELPHGFAVEIELILQFT